MKTILIAVFLFANTIHIFAQENFKWELTDSTLKIKDKLYSDTKMFIAETWKSAKDVIQNDDKENGIILIRGLDHVSTTINMGMQQLTYYFSYQVKFQMKDKKYRITLDNVFCDDASTTGTYKAKVIPINSYTNAMEMGLPKKQYWEVMDRLKLDLNEILNSYKNYISKPNDDF
jgi:hypothetical protein